MAQMKDDCNRTTCDEQGVKQEHINQQFEFIRCDEFAVEKAMNKDNSDPIKLEIKQEELDIPCDCAEDAQHKCYKPIDNLDPLKYESSHDLSIKSPEQSSVVSSSDSLQKTKSRDTKRHTCSICNKEFTQACNLRAHMRIHTGEKPFACTKCDYKCTRSSHLKLHMHTHSGEKPFACSMCQYKCSHPSALKVHMRTHTGEKSFACTVCNYRFAQLSHLKNHMYTHTKEKPFSCTNCRYRCARAFDLRIHLFTHTKEKRFACTKCHYKCALSTHLKAHMRTHK